MNSPTAKILAVVLFLAALAAWIAWPRHMPPPDEANRQWHPDGYSFIRPAGWEGGPEANMADARMAGRITMRPATRSLRMAGVSIINWKEKPDLEKLKRDDHYVDGTFQGNPALLCEGMLKQYWTQRIVW